MPKCKRGNGGGNSKKGDGNFERIIKESKLATRGGGSFKGKVGTAVKRGVESIVEKVGVETFETLLAHTQRHKANQSQLANIEVSNTSNIVGPNDGGNIGSKFVLYPNVTKPPDWETNPYHGPTQGTKELDVEPPLQGEVFVDANDTSTNGFSDSEMEVVVETPSL
ncbi:hypothetical protein P8452_08469 [Trifolium repens]|nr:hypothetical protein P8452_08469 [Trifolium repens]